MSTKQSYYEPSGTNSQRIYASYPSGMTTFKAGSIYSIEKVILRILRMDTLISPPDSVTVGIFNVNGSHQPTGEVLASTTVAWSELPTTYTNYEFVFDLPFNSVLNTYYAIVLTINIGGGSDTRYLDWIKGTQSSWYTGTYYSGAWHLVTTMRFWFQIWGTVSIPSKPINPTPISGTTEVNWSDYTLSWENGGGATSYDVYTGQPGHLIFVGNQIGTSVVISYTTTTDEEGTVRAFIKNSNDEDEETYWNAPFYWQIDARNGSGVVTGDTWNFDPRPAKASNPTPENEYEGMTLDWMDFGWD